MSKSLFTVTGGETTAETETENPDAGQGGDWPSADHPGTF